MDPISPISFDCKNCGQSYNAHSMFTAVGLYGLFFLVDLHKGEKSYSGITCLKCSKTILVECAKGTIEKIKEHLASQVGVTGHDNETGFRYYSSVIHSLDHTNGIEEFDIPVLNQSISDNLTESFESLENTFWDRIEHNPDLSEEYLCSYSPGFNLTSHPRVFPPGGKYFHVIFVKPENIQALVNLEEKTGLKIFPRYYFKNSVIDKTEEFVWDNYLVIEMLKQLQDSDPDNEIFQLMQQQHQEAQEKNAATITNFLNTIASDLEIRDGFLPYSKVEYLMRKKNPFYGQETIETAEWDFTREGKDVEIFQARSLELKKYISKTYVQEFLSENYPKFIEDYIEKAQRRTFSYVDLWRLQKDYLNDLYEHFEVGQRSEAEYAFFKEGNAWTIIFEGKTISGLKGKGFMYMQFMVSRPNVIASHRELEFLEGGSEGSFSEGSDPYDPNITISNNPEQAPTIDDNVDLTKLDYEINILIEVIKLSKMHANSVELLKQKKDLNQLKNYRAHHASVQKRQIKSYRSKEFKNTQDKIANSINRAIKRLASVANKSQNEKEIQAWLHFKESFRNLYESTISYRPADSKIHWHI